jgi:hypothetical protein
MGPGSQGSRKPEPRKQEAGTAARAGPTEASDCRALARAAAALDLSEYDFFRLAYRRWFGRLPREAELEAAFSRYMFAQKAPSWARHLSREVLDRRRRGVLEPDAFGAGRFRDRPGPHPHGRLYVGAVAVLWVVLFGVILNTRYDPGTSGPVSVCVTETGSYFYESWSRLIAGKPPPRCIE